METIKIKEKYNKIIGSGLLLPKDKVSRNGILYDWQSAVETVDKIPGLPMMYNHKVDGNEKPVGHFTDAIALEKRPIEGKWQEIWDKTAEELKIPEGVAGVYYEADINPNSEYADSVTRGDVRKVSIQIIPSDQVRESTDDGDSYTRAYIKDYVESSVVPSPGFMETTLAVMCESFNVKKVTEMKESKPVSGYVTLGQKSISIKDDNYDKAKKLLKGLYVNTSWDWEVFNFNDSINFQKAKDLLKQNNIKYENFKENMQESIKVGDKVHTPSGYSKVIEVKGNKVIVRSQDPVGDFEYDLKDVSKEKITEHLNIGDDVDVDGKKMKVIRTTENGYILEYPDEVKENQTTANNTGVLTTKLPDEEDDTDIIEKLSEEDAHEMLEEEDKMNNKEKLKTYIESLEEDNKMLKEQYEEDMNKIATILEKFKEEIDDLKKVEETIEDEEMTEGVTEETEEESADTPQDEDTVNKNMETCDKKKEDSSTPQDEDAVADTELPIKEDSTTPQDEDAVNKNMESTEDPEVLTEEGEDEISESEDEETPRPPIEEKLSLTDLDKKDELNNHLREVFKF